MQFLAGFNLYFPSMKTHFITLLISAFLLSKASAQSHLIINSEGIPPITTYTGQDYEGFDQVWDITQDNRGLIYLATSFGMHEFDGTTWKTIEIQDGAVPRCFARTEEGIIFLGGIGIMGYLSPDSLGNMSFVSIADKMPVGKNVGRIEFVKTLNGKVFFAGWNSITIFDIEEETIQCFETGSRSYPNFIFNDKVYFKVAAHGLKVYQNDTLQPAPHGGFFNGLAVSDFMTFDNDSVVGISPRQDLYFYSNDTAYKKPTTLDPRLADKFPYKLTKLSDEFYAISYLSAGLVITDNDWNPLMHINDAHGINQEAFKTFLDKDNNLWYASNYGIAVIELASVYSMYGKNAGVSGHVVDFEIKDDVLHVATTAGLFSKGWNSGSSPLFGNNEQFERILNSDIYNDDILFGKGPLLVRSYTTVGQVKDNEYQRLFTKSETQSRLTYLGDSTQAMTIGEIGSTLLIFELKNDKWELETTLKNEALPDLIVDLVYDQNEGTIWGANPSGIFNFKLSADQSEVQDYRSFDLDSGLPDITFIVPLRINGKILFGTKKGLYEFDYESERFSKSKLFGNYFEEKGLTKVQQQNDTIFWYIAGDLEKGKILLDKSGEVTVDWKFSAVMPATGNSLFWNEAGTLIGYTSEIGFIQNNKEENYEFSFPALVRQFDLIEGKDSTLFRGIFTDSEGNYSYVQNKVLVLKSNQNSIRLNFSVPYYRHPDKMEYQFLLEGFESEWSEWDAKTQKEYTNLPAGEYEFKVRARNGFLTKSEEGTFSFEILSPWYETWLAYLLYALLCIGFVRIIIILNSRRLKAKNEKLEQTIKERVIEIEEQKKVISKSLEEKEALLKEIHHRVKNNLQIIANLLYLQSGKFDDEKIKDVLEEGQGRVRSMALIHQKLYENEDLKSIPFGEYILELVNEIKASFGELAANVSVRIDAQEAFFDVDSAVPLGLIINELTTNAFKYAFEGREEGKFNIYLTRSDDEYELHISDNGKGIPEEIDIRKTRSLGLRLVRILSEQLEGQYSFESENGLSFKLKFVA